MRAIKRSKLKKYRGISPIIADILLIGLVVLAGALTFTTVFVVVNTKDPIALSIRNVNDFKLINTDSVSTKYNSFNILLENNGNRDVGILNSSITIYNQSDMRTFSNWVMESDQKIPSKLSKNVFLKSTSGSESDWLSINDTIVIEVSYYALDTQYQTADKSNVSLSIVISKELVSFGPIVLKTNLTLMQNNPALNISDLSNNSLEIAILNYGALDINYTIEFFVSNRTLDLSLTYVNSNTSLNSYFTNTLPGAKGDIPTSTSDLTPNQTIILKVTNKSSTNIGVDEFYITVRLKIKSKIFDILFIIVKT